MNISINKEPFDVTFEEERTLGDVVAGLCEWLHDNDLIVVSLKIDGERSTLEAIDTWRERELTTVDKLAITAKSPNLLTNPAHELYSSLLIIEKILPQVSEIALLFQTGKDREAMQLIARFTKLVSILLNIVPQFDNLNKKIAPTASELNRSLKELLEAFNVKDNVLIGDLMEYEIVPKVETLIGIVHP